MMLPNKKMEKYERWQEEWTNPLGRAKIQTNYAEKLISDIEKDIKSFLSKENINIYNNYQNGWNNFFLLINERANEEILIKLGVIIGVMRESLDHAVCGMIRRNGYEVHREAFPFRESEEKFKKPETRNSVRHLTDSQYEVISETNPFPGDGNTLYELHAICNKKKHRNILVSLMEIFGIDSSQKQKLGQIGVRRIDPFYWYSYGNSDLFLGIEGPEIDEAVFHIGLRIMEDGVKKETIIETLNRYLACVRSFLSAADRVNAELPPPPLPKELAELG